MPQTTTQMWRRVATLFLLLFCFGIVLGHDPHRHQVVTFGMRRLASAINQFGFDVYRTLQEEQSGGPDHKEGEINVAVCPFCVASCLAMVLLGAEGPSETALRQALYLSWSLKGGDVHLAYRDLIAHIGLNLSPPPTDVDSALQVVHHLSVQRHFAVHYTYQFMLDRFYNTSVHRMDFVAEAEQSTWAINDYFARRTGGKAKQMLSRIPSPSTNMLLLSALYFRGTLDMDMGTVQQEGRAFMRAGKARVRYGEHDYLNCTAVEVPFKGGLLSLLALLPKDPAGMRLLETRLSARRLADILNSLQVDTVHFQMPRITIDQTQGRNLTRALYELGLIDLFTPGHANLFGMSNFGWFHVSNVTTAAFVDIRESEQDESARKNAKEEEAPPTKILLDRPFLWFVMDNVAGLVIAMGKMARPGEESTHAW